MQAHQLNAVIPPRRRIEIALPDTFPLGNAEVIVLAKPSDYVVHCTNTKGARTFFVSRHPGALEWMRQNRIPFDIHRPHLDMSEIRSGDTVIGSLPVNLAAEVCERGATYQHLALKINETDRGRELSSMNMEEYGATLIAYDIKRLPT